MKVLGIMGLLDGPETDWKAIVIDIQDPLAPKLNNVTDIETHFPGLLAGTRRWFKTYKVPDGKPENKFALSEECRNKEYVGVVFQLYHYLFVDIRILSYAMDVIRGAAKA